MDLSSELITEIVKTVKDIFIPNQDGLVYEGNTLKIQVQLSTTKLINQATGLIPYSDTIEGFHQAKNKSDEAFSFNKNENPNSINNIYFF